MGGCCLTVESSDSQINTVEIGDERLPDKLLMPGPVEVAWGGLLTKDNSEA